MVNRHFASSRLLYAHVGGILGKKEQEGSDKQQPQRGPAEPTQAVTGFFAPAFGGSSGSHRKRDNGRTPGRNNRGVVTRSEKMNEQRMRRFETSLPNTGGHHTTQPQQFKRPGPVNRNRPEQFSGGVIP